MRTIGGALGGQLAATLLASNLGLHDKPTSHAYGLAFGLCAVALIGSLLIGLLIPRRGRRGAEVAVAT